MVHGDGNGDIVVGNGKRKEAAAAVSVAPTSNVAMKRKQNLADSDIKRTLCNERAVKRTDILHFQSFSGDWDARVYGTIVSPAIWNS